MTPLALRTISPGRGENPQDLTGVRKESGGFFPPPGEIKRGVCIMNPPQIEKSLPLPPFTFKYAILNGFMNCISIYTSLN
jgi:hypothetical protein